MNYSFYFCSGNWGCKWSLLSFSFSILSKFPSPAAPISAGSVACPVIWPNPLLLRSLSPGNYSLCGLRLTHSSIHSLLWTREYHEVPKHIIWVSCIFLSSPPPPPPCESVLTSICWTGSILPVRWWLLYLPAEPKTQEAQIIQVASCCILWRGLGWQECAPFGTS